MINLGRQLVKNILHSWGSYIGRLLIAFFFVPYITSVLGDARYGIWVIIFQIVNYFSVADLGLERALTRYLSKHLATGDYDSVNRVLATSVRLCLIIGLAVMAGSYILAQSALGLFDIADPELLAEGQTALIIIGFYLGIRFWFLPYGGNLHSFQRADIANRFALAEEFARAGLLTYLLSEGFGLAALALGIFSLALIRQLAASLWLLKKFPLVKFSPKDYDRPTSRQLYSYSKISFGITLAFLVLYGSDSILLGLLVSSSAAGIYAPAAQLLLYVRHIVNAATGPLMPALSHLDSTDDKEAIKTVYLTGLKFTTLLSTGAAIGIGLFAEPFVRLWLTEAFAEAAGVMIILGVGSLFFLGQIIGNAIMFATERHKYLFYLALIEAGLKLALAFPLAKRYGLNGIALATAIPQILMYSVIYPVLMSRLLKIELPTIFKTIIRSIIIAGLVTLPLGLLLPRLLPVTNWATLLTEILLISGLGLTVAYRMIGAAERKLYERLNGFKK